MTAIDAILIPARFLFLTELRPVGYSTYFPVVNKDILIASLELPENY
jgi:hypothetical protein